MRLRLPRAARAAEKVDIAPTEVTPRGVGRIMIVEDNAELREMTTALLRELGYAVRPAASPAEAFDLLRGFPADLVFSDILMPGGMNGFEFARELRVRYPGIEVLLTSGDAGVLGRTDQSEFIILQKPYRIDALSAAIRRALENVARDAAQQRVVNE